MTDNKHTPGPISYYKCACGHRACTQYTLSTQGSAGFDEADARLYAAAPDLLAAAEAMRDALPGSWDCEQTPGGREAWNALLAAIAKATGAA